MSLHGTIDKIKNFFTQRKSKEDFNSTDLFKNASMVADMLTTLLDALQTPVFANDFAQAVTQTDHAGHNKQFLTGAAYDKVLGVAPHNWQRLEARQPLITLIALTGSIVEDLKEIMAHYNYFFDDEHVPNEELRMSGIIISGYVHSATQYCNWLVWMILARDHFMKSGAKADPHDHVAPAKYLVNSIQSSLPYAMEMAKEVLNRRKGVTFFKILSAMRTSNHDVKMVTDGVDLSVYAEDSNYSDVELKYSQVGIVNPFMFVGKAWASVQRYFYDRNRDVREWIQMRIALLEQQQAGMDPNSPEYKRIENILKKYLDQISHLDAKIERYETQH